MNIRGNKRLLGLMLTPFALFTACVGLTPEEQAEYKELQEEVRRIQVEEIQPRQANLRDIVEGNLTVNLDELQKQINLIRNERLDPLEHKLAVLQSDGTVFAAPGTRIELEELNDRLNELQLLYSGLQEQIEEHNGLLEAAKKAAGREIEEKISLLEIELEELLNQLEEIGRDTDLRAVEIDDAIGELRDDLETLDEGSEDATGIQAQIEELDAEWTSIHDSETALKSEINDSIEVIEAEINQLREEIESRHSALRKQFGGLIHGMEISLHDVSEDKEAVVRRIQELELSAPEELEKAIDELEGLIESIITTELRPLIERLNEATRGEDPNDAAREQLRAELEEWLTKIAVLRARLNELTSKSFKSLLGGLDLGGLAALGR